jgi:hypothetical protein
MPFLCYADLMAMESFPDTVTRAFERFIHNHTNLNSRQLDFLNLLKDFVLEKETGVDFQKNHPCRLIQRLNSKVIDNQKI